jgi:hypothetical protein
MAGKHWIQTASGKKFFYDDVRPEQFFIPDMAAALSRLCRYNGQLKNTPELEDELYVVGQHSVYVYRFLEAIPECPRRALPWALLHDGVEGYYTDMPSPQKAMDPIYREREHEAEACFRAQYGIPYDATIERWVKYADIQLLWMESQEVCAIPSNLWDVPGTPVMSLRDLDPDFYFWRPKKARMEYLAAFNDVSEYLENGENYANAS